jgi:hypothetical protein
MGFRDSKGCALDTPPKSPDMRSQKSAVPEARIALAYAFNGRLTSSNEFISESSMGGAYENSGFWLLASCF